MDNDNPGAMHWRTALALLVLTLVLVGLDYTGYVAIPDWVCAIPVGYAWLHSALYRLLVGSNLKALQVHERDMEVRYHQNIQMDLRGAVTLDADKMLRSIRADDEGVGRA